MYYRRYITVLLLALGMTASLNAQDICAAFDLSKITSYVKVSQITTGTADELNGCIDELKQKYLTPDYIIDLTETDTPYSPAAMALADGLKNRTERMLFLVGPDTKGAAEQFAFMMRERGKGVIMGTKTQGELHPDVLLIANKDYKTEWYDSLKINNVPVVTAERYYKEHSARLLERYPTAKKFFMNFDENANLVDCLYEVAAEKGITRNDASFFYCGFYVITDLRTALLRLLYPDSQKEYWMQRNAPLGDVINAAREILETSEYKRLLSK